MLRRTIFLVFASYIAAVASAEGGKRVEPKATTTKAVDWFNDYHAAMDAAEAAGKMTFLWFYDSHSTAENDRLSDEILERPEIQKLFAEKCACAKLPTDVKVISSGKEIVLLDHAAFRELNRASGLVLIDMTDAESPLFRQVVSIYPLTNQAITADHLAILLELPPGTLTQRTLTFAVRTHPEHPQSATSQFSSFLASETERHASHQAQIMLQGHHNWDSRFQAINAKLSGGLLAREVCAESWPGQNLVEAAIECVHSWRQSPGHWDAVSHRHDLFAYDMKRGQNGVWYATGIFAARQ
jgi:hypothetical protein